jgi:2-polyprenyl-3-methyl-5-hydroxy-6-metoxy-1,4-benzoquinol methylase
MSSAHPSSGDDPAARVRAQYERFPYPPRDPEEERVRIIGTWLDNLDILNHHCFRGAKRFDRGFRALVAGGGTGDGSIFLAHQLRDTDAEVVHLDVSGAAIDVARRRAAINGYDRRIRFVQASLLDLPRLGLGTFDYVNCIGVLHHLADPDAGLRALLAVLADDGAMALLVYGLYGRTGVYQMQALLRLVNAGIADETEQIAHARAVLAALPASNWFRRGEELHGDHVAGGDAGLYDLLLHPQDRAYTVPELYAWLTDRHGLHLQFSALQRGRLPYAPENVLSPAPPALLARLAHLPERDRQAVAELAAGDLIHHAFYATRRAGTKAPYGDAGYVPLFPDELHRPSGADFVRLIDHHRGQPLRLTHNLARLNRVMEPGRYVRSIFTHLDGRRSFGAIFERVRAEPAFRDAAPDDAALFADFAPWYEALESIERLVLRRADEVPR